MKACRPAPTPDQRAGQLLGLPVGPAESLPFRKIKAPAPAVPEPKPSRRTASTRLAPVQVHSSSPGQKQREDSLAHVT